ncbi:MAG: DUF975 family protein [Bacteroidia bacterium]|nr:DUF975 family protein [Bacteroidia bacterium]
MKTNSEIRSMACDSLRGNWSMPVLSTLLILLISGTTAIPFGGFIALIFLYIPICYSLIQAYLMFIRGDKDNLISKMFDCFNDYGRALGVSLLQALYIILWTLLLFVPGVIKSYSYSQAFFIALDKPELRPEDCINESMQMMNGYKMKLFLLDLSFIGWWLLSILSLGIGFLWLLPYIYTSHSHFYEELKAETTNQ